MTRSSINALFAALALGIAGCDVYSGVTRTYDLKSTIEFDCVESVMASHPMVAEFKYAQEEGGREFTWGGIQEPGQIHRFSYRLTTSVYWTSFFFQRRYDRKFEYFHSFGCVNCEPPQEEVDKYYPFILDIEQRLDEKCAIGGLAEGATEYCMRVECNWVD